VMPQFKHREAPPIEEVGTYDPMVTDKAARVKMNLERIEYWISVGAQPSEAVAALIKKVKTNSFGSAKPAPAAIAPKPLPVKAEPEGEAPAAEGAGESAAGEG
jgi:small subunit ribosomal protein S16